MQRRRLRALMHRLAHLVCLAGCAVIPSAAESAPPTKQRAPGAVRLFHVNHRETLSLRLVAASGRPVPAKVLGQRMQRFLRCHHTGKQHRIDPRLVRLIYRTGRHFSGRRIEVISGYRHPKVATNRKSPHIKGLACDLRVAGVSNALLRDYLRSTFSGIGVGYYPNSSFVHLDVRPGPSAFWIDYSGPGESPVYSPTPGADLRSGRVETWKAPMQGADPILVEDEKEPFAGARLGSAAASHPGAASALPPPR